MSVLILHGLGNRRPPQHWQFHLAAALAADGVPVTYPSLPSPDAPSPQAWVAALDEVPPPTVAVCHSLACALWLGHLATRWRDAYVLLVAPPADAVLREVAPAFAGFAPPPAGAVRGEVWSSDADPYNPVRAAATHAGPLGLPHEVVAGGGHLTPEDGYGRWPAIQRRVRDHC